MSDSFSQLADANYVPDFDDNVISSLFNQYESVIVESLITSFGLDFLINDQHGGDVDTIHNVRKIGKDSEMLYKNSKNKQDFLDNGKYVYAEYHNKGNFRDFKHKAREEYTNNGQTVKDEYVDGNELHFFGSKGGDKKLKAELDHVISAKKIHDDKGRVLSGLSGPELANSPENLKFTNKSLNASMQADDIPDYIEKHPELPQKQKDDMMKHYTKAKKMYDAKIMQAYYTSPKFAKDTAKAAGKVGLKMGLRQALGFIFTEVWFSVKEEFKKIGEDFELSDFFKAIGNGIKNGFENAKVKYKELFSKFIDGAIAGALSSITTTLCNIFFTTAKNTVKLIRQSYASLVQALKILFINPDNLEFGDRMRAICKVLATGVSIVVGVIVNEAIGATGVGKIPVIGDIIQTFCGTLVTGIMSCSLLYFLDRSETMNKLVNSLNGLHTISTEVNYFYNQALIFENYAAELMKIDIQKFKEETEQFNILANNISENTDNNELNRMIKTFFKKNNIPLPWDGLFDNFMNDPETVLVFK